MELYVDYPHLANLELEPADVLFTWTEAELAAGDLASQEAADFIEAASQSLRS